MTELPKLTIRYRFSWSMNHGECSKMGKLETQGKETIYSSLWSFILGIADVRDYDFYFESESRAKPSSGIHRDIRFYLGL